MTADSLKNNVFSISSPEQFAETAREVFRFQYEHVSVYREFCEALGVGPNQMTDVRRLPFLPIELFKSRRISTDAPDALVFESSSTGGLPSRHHVAEPDWYHQSFQRGFERVYGPAEGQCILALLPAYLERSGSSLVYMADHLIRQSGHPDSGFYLNNRRELAELLARREAAGERSLLLGVSFALLDLADEFPQPLKHTVVMETGGMKGRRRELTREELHDRLKTAFQLREVHSEYGMTELLSQAYSTGGGIFDPPPWMQVFMRDSRDPMEPLGSGKTGAINIIDLANVNSCSFLATSDLGRTLPGGRFEVLGRLDQSDIRGCNLMIL